MKPISIFEIDSSTKYLKQFKEAFNVLRQIALSKIVVCFDPGNDLDSNDLITECHR